MAKSPELDRVIGMIKARAQTVRKTTDEDRASYENMLASMPMADDIETERIGAGGVPAE